MLMSKRTATALLLAGALSGAAACGDDDGDDKNPGNPDGSVMDAGGDAAQPPPPPPDSGTPTDMNGMDGGTQMLTACPAHPNVKEMGRVCVITAPRGGEIKTDLTLSPVQGKDGYLLQDGVFVGEDVGGNPAPDTTKARATLTITPGTKLFGEGRFAFLLIQRGSKIEAVGTASQPIVFTSGQSAPAPGDWGGLVINGRAPVNRGIDVAGEADTGKYGGTDPADDSGTLKYVRLEFTGGKVDDMNELNGVAFQGVGNGTEVDFVHTHAGDDDGIEFFGGTVNAKHLVVTAAGDDSLDWVAGYSGKIQYAIVQQWTRVSSGDPTGIEADNLSSMPLQAPISNPTLANITLIGGAGVANGRGANLRHGTKAKIYSSVWSGWNTGCLLVDGADSAGYAGTDLAMFSSRVACATDKNFIASNGATAAATMFNAAGSNNMAIAEGTPLFTDATSKTAPKFTPVSGSPLLTGGTTPSDPFFTPETFIGAMGTNDWTAGGWVAFTPSAALN